MVRIYQSARCSHSGFPCLRCYENQASTLVLALQRSEPWAVGSSSTLARVVRESLRGVETGVGYFKDRDAVTAGVMVTAAAQAFISAMRRPLERHRARAADAARAAAEAARVSYARAPDGSKMQMRRYEAIPEWEDAAVASGLRAARAVLRLALDGDGAAEAPAPASAAAAAAAAASAEEEGGEERREGAAAAAGGARARGGEEG